VALFCKPLAYLFNQSIASSLIPLQWKQAIISPILKTSSPKDCPVFRPISVTPVLTRVMERLIVRQFLYPALLVPSCNLTFSDQYAFHPTGSATAALVQLFHTVTELLNDDPYVAVIALDFSKAFDTVCHVTLLQKLARLDIPDCVYNWLVDYFSGHSHCTAFHGDISSLLNISASIIQGLAVGPVSYVVNAADLTPLTPGNRFCKYADYTYLIIPASNINSRTDEIDSICTWASTDNLNLNLKKSVEIVFVDSSQRHQGHLPIPLDGIPHVSSIKILGITVSSHLSVSEHVSSVIYRCAQTIHALRILRSHGLCNETIHHVYRSVIIGKLLYAVSAWWGFTSAADRQCLQALLQRGIHSGLCSPETPTLTELAESIDDTLFQHIMHTPHHVIHHLLPARHELPYNIRQRHHDRQLSIISGQLCNRNFIYHMLFKDCYQLRILIFTLLPTVL